jgi:transcriptional regulator with XRE-family HTH domain
MGSTRQRAGKGPAKDPGHVALGNNLRAARLRKEMTAKEAGAAINRDGGTVFHWEYGMRAPPFDDIRALARLYGLKLAELLRGVSP